MTGTYSIPSPSTLTVLSVSDLEYLPRLAILAKSISRNMPGAHLHAWLVNVSPGRDVKALSRIHPPSVFTHVGEVLDSRRTKMGLDGKTLYTEKSGFCVNLRARAIHRLLLTGHELVLCLDADSIVRRDLSDLVDIICCNDIVIHKREKEPEYMRVAGGAIGIQNTPASVAFFARMIEHIDKLGPRVFFSDQWAFHLTALERAASTEIADLPMQYIDWEFREESAIWMGKGQRKHHNTTYRREEDRYRP